MLHVVSLPIDEAAEVEYHTPGFVALTENGRICVLESGELFPVALALPLELFRDVLLKDKRFESIVALLFGAVEALSEASGVIFLLLDERCEAAIFAFVSLNLDFELLCLFGKLFGESLEFEELPMLVHSRLSYVKRDSYLLLPAFELIHKEVVPLSDFGKLAIHSTLEIDKILPSFHGISRVLISFSDNLIEVAH